MDELWQRYHFIKYSLVVSKFYDYVYTHTQGKFRNPKLFLHIIHEIYENGKKYKLAQKINKNRKEKIKISTIPSFYKNHILIHEIGKFSCRNSPPQKGKFVNAFIIKTKIGKYKLILTSVLPDAEKIANIQKIVGIDVGIIHFLTLSNGMKIDKENYFELYKGKIIKIKENLRRKRKHSANYLKLERKLHKLYEKIHNKKYYFLCKISSILSNEYDLICMETLLPSNFIKCGGKRSMLWCDATIVKFQKMLEQKCKLKGKHFLKAPKFFPSSQLCSACGCRESLVKDIFVKTWRCKQCTILHDRDLNAAVNLRKYGIKQMGLDPY